MVLATPHHEAATQAHHAIFNVDHARLAPGFEDPVDRPAPVEVIDVRAEKASRLPPRASPQQIARGRLERSRIYTPAHPPRGSRLHVEIETRQSSGWPNNARQLA